MPSKISSNFTEVEERKIHYLAAGEGPTILLLHGWPTSSYLWRKIMPALAERHQVIAMDLPGFGKSDKILDDSYSFRYYQKIIDGFLQKLGIEKIILGVHDLGGPLGLYWAVENKEKIDKLILTNTLVYPEFSLGVKLFGLATHVPILKNFMTSQEGIKRAISFGLHQKEKLSAEAIEQYQAPFEDRRSRKVLLKTVQNLSPKAFQHLAKKLSDFDCPVQIVYGEKDRILPKVKDTMQRVKKDLPQANVVSFSNCGHFFQEEEPEKIVEVLLDFLKV